MQGPPLVPGQDTRAILRELGYDDDRIDAAGGGPRPSSTGRPLTCRRRDPAVTDAATTQFFWDAIADGRLVFQRCAACGVVRHPPAPMCGECHSVEWDTQESSGHGHVYTWIVSHHPTKPDAEPRIVVLVELDEGIRFVANLARRRARRRARTAWRWR